MQHNHLERLSLCARLHTHSGGPSKDGWLRACEDSYHVWIKAIAIVLSCHAETVFQIVLNVILISVIFVILSIAACTVHLLRAVLKGGDSASRSTWRSALTQQNVVAAGTVSNVRKQQDSIPAGRVRLGVSPVMLMPKRSPSSWLSTGVAILCWDNELSPAKAWLCSAPPYMTGFDSKIPERMLIAWSLVQLWCDGQPRRTFMTQGLR